MQKAVIPMCQLDVAELKIIPVTAQNREAVLAMRVAEGQEGFIESTRDCLREADELSLWRPAAVCLGDAPIGFAMYGLFPGEGDKEQEERGRVWLDRFLIDRRFQGRGYGECALRLLLSRLRTEYGCGRVYLSLYEDNGRALSLYEKLGFVFNGELDVNGEQVMVLSVENCKFLS